MARLQEAYNNSKKARLVESYKNDIAEVEKLFGKELKLEKKITLATTINNTKERLMEATQVTGIGPYKRYAIDMLKVSQPTNIISDIVSEQAIDTMYSMINYKKFTYGSDKGKVKIGDTVNSAYVGPKSDAKYAGEEIEAEVIGSAGETTLTGSVAWTPVRPGTFVIESDGVAGVADETGAITGTGITSGTIDAATGTFTITLAKSATEDVLANYSYVNDVAPVNDVPELDLKIVSKPIFAKLKLLKTNYSFMSAYQYKKEYGADIEADLAEEAASEIMNEQTIEIIKDLYTMSVANAPVVFERTQSHGVSVIEQNEGFIATLEEAAETVKQSTRRYRPNYIIAGTKVTTIIRTMKAFVPTGTVTPGTQLIGKLGEFDVYSCPDLANDQFVMGYKGQSMLDAGYVFAPYMPILPTDLITDDTFTGRRGWAAYFGKAKLVPQMYVKGKVVV